MPARKKAKSRRTPEKLFRHDRKGRALQEIGATIVAGGKGHDVVEEIAQLVQRTCKYRWVGVYKIKRKDFVIEAATNKMKPACPRFPVKQGLSAKALEKRRTVMVPDVSKQPCFLPNSASTNSARLLPITDDE